MHGVEREADTVDVEGNGGIAAFELDAFHFRAEHGLRVVRRHVGCFRQNKLFGADEQFAFNGMFGRRLRRGGQRKCAEGALRLCAVAAALCVQHNAVADKLRGGEAAGRPIEAARGVGLQDAAV